MFVTFIIVGIVAGIFIFTHPFFGLILTTLMMPQAILQAATDRFIGFVSGTPIKLIGAITFTATFLKMIGKDQGFSFLNRPVFKIYTMWLLFIYFSGFTQIGGFTRSNFTIFTLMGIFGFLILALVDSIQRFRIILWTALIATFVSSLGAVLRFGALSTDRMSGEYYGPNEFAILLLPIIALSFYTYFSTKNKGARILLVIIAITLVLALISTVSRGGIVGLAAMALIAAFRAKRKMMALLLLAVTVIVFMNFMPQSMHDRFSKTKIEENYTGEGTIDSTIRRYNLSLAAWNMFLQRPIIGFGIGNYFYNCSQYALVEPGRAHNMYLEVMAELGIVGITLLLAMFFSTFKTLNRICKLNSFPASAYASGLYVGLIGFCIAAIFLHAQQEKILWFIIFMSAALEKIAFSHERMAKHVKNN